jgi:hypothetical protein
LVGTGGPRAAPADRGRGKPPLGGRPRSHVRRVAPQPPVIVSRRQRDPTTARGGQVQIQPADRIAPTETATMPFRACASRRMPYACCEACSSICHQPCWTSRNLTRLAMPLRQFLATSRPTPGVAARVDGSPLYGSWNNGTGRERRSKGAETDLAGVRGGGHRRRECTEADFADVAGGRQTGSKGTKTDLPGICGGCGAGRTEAKHMWNPFRMFVSVFQLSLTG